MTTYEAMIEKEVISFGSFSLRLKNARELDEIV
jgi:hypothetical protein